MTHEDYTVAWICALPLEAAASKAMLDKIHPQLSQSTGDDNSYTLGEISGHNIVMTCLPLGMYGIVSAATVAARMRITFPSIRFGLMIGIGILHPVWRSKSCIIVSSIRMDEPDTEPSMYKSQIMKVKLMKQILCDT